MALLVAARRRLARLGPAWGAGPALALGAAATGVLLWLRPHPAAWAAGAAVVLVTAGWRLRPRRRRPGPYRVLHLGFEAPQRPGAGGGSVRTHEVNRRLAGSGVEVIVACARYPGFRPTELDGVRYLPFGLRLSTLTNHHFASQLAYFAAVVTGLWWLVRRWDPDVVVEDFAAPFSSVCVPYLTRRPVVGVVQWLFAQDKARQYHLPFGAVERRGVRAHTHLVAVSDDLGAELRRRNPAAEVSVVPNGLEPSAHTPRPGRTRDHLLYLGRLEIAQKGLDLLLHAYAQASPALTADLYIAGDGPDGPALRALADRLGIGPRVHWLGRANGDDRFDLLAAARLVCMPSRYETFGMVAAEALAVGTPVLAFDIPCLRALVGPQVGVRVPAGDVPALAAALAELGDDPARCAAWARPGRPASPNWTGTPWQAQLAAYGGRPAGRAGCGRCGGPDRAHHPRPPAQARTSSADRQLRQRQHRRRGHPRPARGARRSAPGPDHRGQRDPSEVDRLHGLAAVRTTSWQAVRAFLRTDAVAVGGGGMFGRGLPPLVAVLPAVRWRPGCSARRSTSWRSEPIRTPRSPPAGCSNWPAGTARGHRAGHRQPPGAVRRARARVRPVLVADPAETLTRPHRRGWPPRPASGSPPAAGGESEGHARPGGAAPGAGLGGAGTARAVTAGRPAGGLPLPVRPGRLRSGRGIRGCGAGPAGRRAGRAARPARFAGPGLHPAVAKALVGGAAGVLAMRLHAQIFAVCEQTPLLGSFEAKADAWLSATGSEACRTRTSTPRRSAGGWPGWSSRTGPPGAGRPGRSRWHRGRSSTDGLSSNDDRSGTGDRTGTDDPDGRDRPDGHIQEDDRKEERTTAAERA
ncbi:glycosyltransferase [Streptacidiphilus sp. 4-A2]|nr:glycosyltransferase [Streptacidiphilus sp. 4-A2]